MEGKKSMLTQFLSTRSLNTAQWLKRASILGREQSFATGQRGLSLRKRSHLVITRSRSKKEQGSMGSNLPLNPQVCNITSKAGWKIRTDPEVTASSVQHWQEAFTDQAQPYPIELCTDTHSPNQWSFKLINCKINSSFFPFSTLSWKFSWRYPWVFMCITENCLGVIL